MKHALKKAGWIVLFFFFAYGVASFLNDYVIQYEEVRGTSMEPCLEDKEHVFISLVPYWFQEPERFDVIAFSWNGELYVKRILALPGETIAAREGKIFIDGQLLLEDYGKEEIRKDFEAEVLKEDEYFVLGDNRNYSTDSRQKELGPVKKSQITGKVLFK